MREAASRLLTYGKPPSQPLQQQLQRHCAAKRIKKKRRGSAHLQARRVVSVEAQDAGTLAAASWARAARRRPARGRTAARHRAARARRTRRAGGSRPLGKLSATGLSLASLHTQ